MSLTTVQDIERAIGTLTPHELEELQAWFDRHCPQPVAGQPKADLDAGRTDQRISRAVAGSSMATLDWSQCPAVESVPGKVSGAWVLKGTRMPVSAIFENLEAGASIDDIMEWFDGLDRDQVKAVIEFAVRSLDKPPEYAPAP
jgi:uncharacterized protein (DUF433 family)